MAKDKAFSWKEATMLGSVLFSSSSTVGFVSFLVLYFINGTLSQALGMLLIGMDYSDILIWRLPGYNMMVSRLKGE